MWTKKKIRQAVDAAEVKFIECFEILMLIKRGPPALGESIDRLFEFQPLLCHALMELEKVYHGVRHEQKRLIERKKSFNHIWFSGRSRCLEDYCQVVENCIFLGKSMGDSFAWFFYQNDRELLGEHAEHERILHLPVGTGALGELEFIKGIKGMGEALIIYHGTTNILRIGDVSLVDCKMLRIIGLGELKTKTELDNKLVITLHLIAKNKLPMPVVADQGSSNFKNDPKFQDRLNKQMKKMSLALDNSRKNANPVHSTQIVDNMHVAELALLMKNLQGQRAAWQKIGDGLVLMAVKVNRSSLSQFYFDLPRGRSVSRFKGVEFTVKEIVDSSAGRSNSLMIGSFYGFDSKRDNHVLGFVPHFWWPIEGELMKKIMFGEVLIITIYNSLHLRRKLQQAGFMVKTEDGSHNFSVRFVHEGKKAHFIGLKFMSALITNQLMQESAVVALMEQAAKGDHMKTIPADQSAVIHLNIQQFI